ncbi:polyketide synthase, partial [Mycobacterium attenuatum]|uniref:beta-ketoacyl [acyl carrier protein] synthase domain-containing protein n=1 Tax=Mycobacterium attenuatum TaxID=2341086 RepID=UPI0010A94E82
MASDSDQIAIIGLSCRVPGAVNPSEYWQLLIRGQSCISHSAPYQRSSRIFVDERDGPDCLKYGAYLEDADYFDAPFFGISDDEAVRMDPQQRLALELVWSAFEDARIIPEKITDKPVGLFIGAMRDDYSSLLARHHVAISPRSTVGSLRSVIAGRISHFFGLTGPSLVVDTGQSSSLTAIILAIDSLQRGECDLAVAGGVHLNLDPYAAESLAELGVLSPGGICRPFDDRADGYVRGEGGGVVVLTKVASALAHKAHIYCAIRGGAIINDGSRSGLVNLTADGHRRLFNAALAAACTEPSDVDYVETHGTATPTGDIAEAEALISVYRGRSAHGVHPLIIGSAKPNIGHLEAAAGVMGVIKVALALKNDFLPPTINFAVPNAALTGHESSVRVLTAASEWPHTDHIKTAAVSAFGVSGTNAHLIIQQPPPQPTPP